MEPGANDLIKLETLKQYLRIGKDAMTDVDDTLLQQLITGASAFMLKDMNRTSVNVSNYTEQWLGRGESRFVPNVDPLVSVTLVQIGATVIPASSDGMVAGYWIASERQTKWIELIGYSFTPCIPAKVTYMAGFSPIPDDMALACCELSGTKYRERKRLGLVSEAAPQGMGTMTYSTKDVSDFVRNTIEQYTLRF